MKQFLQRLLSPTLFRILFSISSLGLIGAASYPTTHLLTAEVSEQLSYQSVLLINGHTVHTEVVDNQRTRALGLMHRHFLPRDAGMLFVFQDDKPRCFWMKDTVIPLSLAYIDADGKIFNIFDLTPKDETSICSTKAARFALEVNQGWFTQKGIKIGDMVYLAKAK